MSLPATGLNAYGTVAATAVLLGTASLLVSAVPQVGTAVLFGMAVVTVGVAMMRSNPGGTERESTSDSEDAHATNGDGAGTEDDDRRRAKRERKAEKGAYGNYF